MSAKPLTEEARERGNAEQREMCARLKAEGRTPRRMGLAPDRSCHDCRKPTWNHRCPACLEKWRRKHGASGEAADAET